MQSRMGSGSQLSGRLRPGHEMVVVTAQPDLILGSRSRRLLRLPARQYFLARVAELVLLLVQTRDDTAAAGRRAGAIFVIIRLAGAALVGGLSNRRSGASDGERENGEA